MMINSKSIGTLPVLLIGLAAVSTSSIFIRWMGDTPAAVIAAYRLTIAGLILGTGAAVRGEPPFLRASRKEAVLMTLSGVALALHFVFWIASLKLTSVASSVVLVATSPIWTALMSRLVLKEKLTAFQVGGIALAVAGYVVLGLAGSGGGRSSLMGNALALSGGVMAALYLTAGRIVRRTRPTFYYTGTVYLIAAALVIAITFAWKQPLTGYTSNVYILLLLVALLPQLVGHTTFNWALKRNSAVTVAVMMMGEPVGATILAMIFLAEFPGFGEIAGGAVLLGGIYLTTAKTETA